MAERIYLIDLSVDGRNRYRHRHVLEKDQIVEFSVQFEAHIAGRWRPIVRYDSAHGFGHRDLMHSDGTTTKTSFQYWDYAEVLIYGERDLKQNWRAYRENYLKELEQYEARTRSKQ